MKKALVLGAGGPVGIAWESGLIAGMAEAGLDVSSADFVLGTSAGSFVGAQLALGRTPAEIAAPDLTGPLPASGPVSDLPDLSMLIGKILEAASGKRPAAEVMAEIGTMALAAPAISEEEFIGKFSWALGDGTWPSKEFGCTAVDTADGSFRVWDRNAGIDLSRAVASSCAVPGMYPPISFEGRRYMDGGMRSGTNADLARDYDAVLIVMVRPKAIPSPIAEVFGARFERELKALSGRVEVIVPDEGSNDVMGMNLMDSSRRRPAAEAGLVQGRAEAARVAEIWK
ncbi:MAG: patatin-like phospholipase family protein [Acidobacteriia bacterium]|nr:patatin-like phospholipase family protein [Terriglobia bacterium]